MEHGPGSGRGQGHRLALPGLEAGDIVVDSGNSYYKVAIRHAERPRHLRPTLPGLWHQRRGPGPGAWILPDDRWRGKCLSESRPIFKTLVPRPGDSARTAGRDSDYDTAEQGYLHCGPSGAGHFVKMVHNGIEYALIAAYAEGMNLLKHAGVGRKARTTDAETAP